MSTWEQRMSKRAKTAATKRRLRKNLEGNSDRTESTLMSDTVSCRGSEPVTAEHWAAWFGKKEEEWPDVVGEESVG